VQVDSPNQDEAGTKMLTEIPVPQHATEVVMSQEVADVGRDPELIKVREETEEVLMPECVACEAWDR